MHVNFKNSCFYQCEHIHLLMSSWVLLLTVICKNIILCSCLAMIINIGPDIIYYYYYCYQAYIMCDYSFVSKVLLIDQFYWFISSFLLMCFLPCTISHTHTGYEKAVVCGQDWGGVITWEFGGRYPEMCDKIIVLNCPHRRAWAKVVRTQMKQFLASW